VAAVFTLPLLFVGGSVTTYGVGLAVPDWPTTFGINMFLYDFWNAPFGVRVEHTHRLYGAAVGLATVILAGWFLAFDRRRSMKILGIVALGAVIVQGVIGGTRVTQSSTLLAAVHGCLGQGFFGLMVALCVLTGRHWRATRAALPDPAQIRARSAVLLAIVAAQIVLGSWFRHFRYTPALAIHGLLALGLLAHALALFRAVARGVAGADLRIGAPAVAIVIATLTQIMLGIGALWLTLPLGGNPHAPGLWQAMMRTAHQTNGALVLGASVVLALRSYHGLRRAEPGRKRLDRAPSARPVEAVV
jgi:cytochrome c oxidase assembly protein subunit 15